jgi:hypothetical protein
MTNKMPYYTLEELRDLIKNPAKELGWKPQDLVPKLEIISTKYIKAIDSYREAETRGEILRSLNEILQESDEALTGITSNLPVEAIQALMGAFPNTLVHYTDIKSHDHVAWVANDDAIMKASFQSRMALQSQRNEPNLVRVELHRAGSGIFKQGDEDFFQSCLVSIAEVDPAQLRQLAQHTIDSLTKVFQFDATSNGRNTNVLDGVRANADWQLYELILDEIWPMENGELHSKSMQPVRDIINGVMIYVWGTEKPKRGKGNKITDAKEGVKSEDEGLFLDKAILSNVLTLRHQINSLSRALEIATRRFGEIEASRNSLDNPGPSLNAVDRLVLYPLQDWVKELKRRLEFGDYRPHDRGIRRPTGEILPTPRMPKFKKKTTEHERMHALIEAAAPLVKGGRASDKEKRLLDKAFSVI